VPDDAYRQGVRLLGSRELSAAQLRQRLARRQLADEDIEAAIERLKREGALNDRRTALMCARAEAGLKHHGRRRALRRIESIGIPADIARAAVDEVFADVDENLLIQRVVERRLGPPGPADRHAVGSVFRRLLRQGFDADRIRAALRPYRQQASPSDLDE
jgi:SOS response regulatory protein OraA/RecX